MLQTIYKKFRMMWGRFRVIADLFGYLWENKMWWLIPCMVFIALMGALLIIGEATPLGAFIYTIF